MGVKSYTESKSLLQYEGKVELGEEQESSFGSGAKKKQLPPIESNPGIKETLYSMFLPREWEENGKKFIQYVSRDLFKALDEKIKERHANSDFNHQCPLDNLYAMAFYCGLQELW